MNSEITHLDMDAEPHLDAILCADPRISSTSRWSDAVWTLDGDVGGKTRAEFRIRWGVAAPRQLIDEAKLLAAILFLKRGEESILAPGTAAAFSTGIRYLLRFMANFAYSSFTQLDGDAFKLFVKNLPVRLADPEWWVGDADVAGDDDDDDGLDLLAADDPDPVWFEPAAAATPTPGDGPQSSEKVSFSEQREESDELTRASAYVRLRIWKQLLRHGPEMQRAGARALLADPFAGKSLWRITEDVASVASVLIPPLPDKVALKVMGRALELIGQPADDVIALQRKYAECRTGLAGNPGPAERERIREGLTAFKFSKVGGSPWRERIASRPGDYSGGAALRDLIDTIRDAAVLTIFCGTGVRISELCGLRTGPMPTSSDPIPCGAAGEAPERLPHCVTTSISKTGLNEHLFMNGKLYKNERTARDEKWLIGARPRGDVAEPPVLRAIRVLERLYAPWRPLSSSPSVGEQLILSFNTAGHLPVSSSGVRAITSAVLRRSTRRFVASWCRLDELEAEAERDPKLVPYVRSRGACIQPHQWRKTFALYMMKVDDRMVPALARHFKHMTVAVTENSYMPKDPSMLAAHDSVHAQEAAKWFYEQRHGAGGRFGRLDEIMSEHRAEWEKLVADLPFDEAVPKVQRFCLEQDIRIFHAEHGRCVIAANPDQARCHEAGGTSSWRNTRPNHLTRTPSLCAGCSNFTVSAEHAGFWRRRYIDNETAWRRSDRSTQFRVIQKRAMQASQVLKTLGVPFPVLLVEAASDRAARRGTTTRADTTQPAKEA